MKKTAKFWKKLENKKTQCNLCDHNCKIDNGKMGICAVRKNENGELFTLIYGSTSSMAADPIEKKPLYHFHPGTNAFSMGTVGCNFKCEHCQNYGISTASLNYPYLQDITPEQVVEYARKYNCEGIAWTYNEPTIWHEFSYDSSKLAKKAGLYTCYVTNGFIQEEPLKEISPFLDAMNIDIKAFNEDFYKKICKARLEPVLNTSVIAKKLGIHIELTYLIIPGYNDSKDEIKKFCDWIINNLDNKTPVHFSRFHPDHKMNNIRMTPMETMIQAYEIARKSGVRFVYLGNIPSGEYENTICPKCGNICVKRYGFSIETDGLKNGKCSKCGTALNMVF